MITPFLLYIGRASLYLAIFYAFFLLVMRKTSFFRFNRAVLLLGAVACHLLPLLRLRTVIVNGAGEATAQAGEPVMVGVGAQGAAIGWPTGLYLAGVAAVAALVLISVLRTLRLIRGGETRECDGYRLTLMDRDVPSFSWCRHIVMARADYEKYPAILRHELQHIRHAHSLDILLMTGFAAVHWFNPLVWIARTELALLHEYEADEGLIRQGIDATQYQLLLVRKAVGEQRFSMANGFNHAKLKQRIAMMHKKQTPSFIRLAYVGVLPILAIVMFACNPANKKISEEAPDVIPITTDTPESAGEAVGTFTASEPESEPTPAAASEEESIPFGLVQIKPKFQGGDANTFAKWVSEHLSYPDDARDAGISGRVTVQFRVDENGQLRDAKVIRGVYPSLDAEAVRVIASSPKWTPGRNSDKPVSVTYIFPVIFKLK